MIIELAFRWTDDDSEPVWMRRSLSGLEALGAIPEDWALSASENEAQGEDRKRLVGLRILNRFLMPQVVHPLSDAASFRDWVISVREECERRAQKDWWLARTTDEHVAEQCADIFQSYWQNLGEVCEAAEFIVASIVQAAEYLEVDHVSAS